MDKMKMETPDLTKENVEKLLALFPECATEVEQQGKVTRGVNFETLKQLLTPYRIEGNEAYEFTWVGKKEAIVEANRPIRKTLRPVPEKSKDWQKTENLYIEGDNLEALKLLQEAYLGQVKMIYIDPPYNTGNDFIYNDTFKMSEEELAEGMGLFDEEGNRKRDKKFAENSATNPRFHSDWCSMIYSRLLVAKKLLSEDGVVFISIDENELTNLRKISDEVFGSRNFVVQIIWKKRSTPPNDQVIGAAHEYIVVYAKDAFTVKLNLRKRTDEQNARYQNPDNHPKGPWASGDLSANVKGGRFVQSLNYPIINPNTGEAHYPPNNGNWRFSKEKVDELLRNNEIFFGKDGKGRPKLKRFLSDIKDGITYTSLWDFVPLNTVGSAEMTEIFGNLSVFENPKPTGLIKEILALGSDKNTTILDFFSGSATTAHAVMQMNAEDGGHRRFIMVQLPEKTDEKSEAKKAGFDTICDIGEERIRRAGEKIKAESPLTTKELDTGFRVFRVDDSNMKDVYYSADELSQDVLDGMISNIKEDRSALDLLFGCLVDWSVPLSKKCTSETVDHCTVYDYGEGDLVACFDRDIPESVIEGMARKKPLRVVFRDDCFTGSQDKINVFEVFKLLSPDTTIRVL